MKLDIQIINPIECEGWDTLILSHPDYSFFHSSIWAEVLKKSYGYTPLYFVAFKNKKISALLPVMEVRSFLTGKTGVSLPFTDSCNPICNGNIGFVHLFNQVIDFGRKHGWKYIELRGGYGLDPDSFSPNSEITRNLQPLPAEASAQAGETRTVIPSFTYLGHTLSLEKSEQSLYKGLRDSTRRNIKKAKGEGVEVKISDQPESIEQFFSLNSVTRKRHGLPPQPLSFFRNVLELVIMKGYGFVVLGFHEGKAIAASVFFHFGKKAVYKYGASDLEYQSLRANNLVMWEAIKWYSQNG
jgi:lipid II:glycine glycyltransferase (peptidoglycan interpeptide bridge formation enzyme)